MLWWFRSHSWLPLHLLVMSIRSKRELETSWECWSNNSAPSLPPSSLALLKAGSSRWSSWPSVQYWAFQQHFTVRWVQWGFFFQHISMNKSWSTIDYCECKCASCLGRCSQHSPVKSRELTPKQELWQRRCSLQSGQCLHSAVKRERLPGV